jgi:hypothetical protein
MGTTRMGNALPESKLEQKKVINLITDHNLGDSTKGNRLTGQGICLRREKVANNVYFTVKMGLSSVLQALPVGQQLNTANRAKRRRFKRSRANTKREARKERHREARNARRRIGKEQARVHQVSFTPPISNNVRLWLTQFLSSIQFHHQHPHDSEMNQQRATTRTNVTAVSSSTASVTRKNSYVDPTYLKLRTAMKSRPQILPFLIGRLVCETSLIMLLFSKYHVNQLKSARVTSNTTTATTTTTTTTTVTKEQIEKSSKALNNIVFKGNEVWRHAMSFLFFKCWNLGSFKSRVPELTEWEATKSEYIQLLPESIGIPESWKSLGVCMTAIFADLEKDMVTSFKSHLTTNFTSRVRKWLRAHVLLLKYYQRGSPLKS